MTNILITFTSLYKNFNLNDLNFQKLYMKHSISPGIVFYAKPYWLKYKLSNGSKCVLFNDTWSFYINIEPVNNEYSD